MLMEVQYLAFQSGDIVSKILDIVSKVMMLIS